MLLFVHKYANSPCKYREIWFIPCIFIFVLANFKKTSLLVHNIFVLVRTKYIHIRTGPSKF
jgi:hypothetical protein